MDITKKEIKFNWLRWAGLIIIADGVISLIHPELTHNVLFDSGRIIRIIIGTSLLAYKND